MVFYYFRIVYNRVWLLHQCSGMSLVLDFIEEEKNGLK